MSTIQRNTDLKPWYKQFWPWFLIALPLCVVVASFTTLAIFSANSVSLVAEDYYKKGKAINVDLTKVKMAQGLELSAEIWSKDNRVSVQFNKGQLEYFPALTFTFTHRTLADQDFIKTVSSDANGLYQLELESDIKGPWFVEIEAHDKNWMLQGKVFFPSELATKLADG